MSYTRRQFLEGTSAISAASLLGLSPRAAAEPPPEVKKIRLLRSPIACMAPQYLADELLRMEGFRDVEYVRGDTPTQTAPAASVAGKVDIAVWDALHHIQLIDSGHPIVVLAGLHAGCWELFGNDRVNTLRDLKGTSIGVWGIGAGDHMLLSSMLAYVGIDPRKAINWIPGEDLGTPMRLFLEGKTDAFMGFAPQPQELRAKRNSAKVIIDTVEDKPWSQYFCCVVSTSRDFVNRNPIATKRALRAILKAADLCSQEPARAAKLLQAKGYEPRYELALEVLKKLPYRRWREGSPEDTLRFHALRLHEVGMIKMTPQKIIAQGTDLRFLNELKKELKA